MYWTKKQRVTKPKQVEAILKDCGITLSHNQRAEVFLVMEGTKTVGVRVDTHGLQTLRYFEVTDGQPVHSRTLDMTDAA